MTDSLADWQLKTRKDWGNSSLTWKINWLKQCLQFKAHKLVNDTTWRVFSHYAPSALLLTFQSAPSCPFGAGPLHLPELTLLQHFWFLSRPSGSSVLASYPPLHPCLTSAFCSMLRTQTWGSLLCPPPPRPTARGFWLVTEVCHPAWGWGDGSTAQIVILLFRSKFTQCLLFPVVITFISNLAFSSAN